MLRNIMIKNVVAAVAVGGVLAVTQLAGAGLVTASPTVTPVAYPAGVTTTTDLQLDNRVKPGEANTARVTVTADDGSTPQGTATLKVQGRQARTKALVDGETSFAMPRDLRAGRTYRVVATYKRYTPDGIWKTSRDTAYVTVKKRGSGEVLGEEGERGNGSANRGAPSGDVAGTQAGLPDTGADNTTQLYALGGLGLLAAGAFSLLMHRRRSHG